ncbi:hypothetical protein C8R46DRAFT_1042119 [Mycena filopes]|nr:hypothetical protein C8R46DRAFT_1042119 [Mycena filopes]
MMFERPRHPQSTGNRNHVPKAPHQDTELEPDSATPAYAEKNDSFGTFRSPKDDRQPKRVRTAAAPVLSYPEAERRETLHTTTSVPSRNKGLNAGNPDRTVMLAAAEIGDGTPVMIPTAKQAAERQPKRVRTAAAPVLSYSEAERRETLHTTTSVPSRNKGLNAGNPDRTMTLAAAGIGDGTPVMIPTAKQAAEDWIGGLICLFLFLVTWYMIGRY